MTSMELIRSFKLPLIDGKEGANETITFAIEMTNMDSATIVIYLDTLAIHSSSFSVFNRS